MNLTYPHTLPRQLGAKTFIVWFLLACAEQEKITPVSRDWILDHMPDQTSPNTVTAALRWLCSPENQLAVRVTGGWRLASAVQLSLIIENLSTYVTGEADQKRAERAFEVSSSRYKEVNDSKDLLLLPDEKRAERVFQVSAKSKEDRQACIEACKETGIHNPAASELSDLAWVTPDYIRAHAAEAKRCGQPVSLAIWRMKNQWSAPEINKSEANKNAIAESTGKLTGHEPGCKCTTCTLSRLGMPICPDCHQLYQDCECKE